MINIQYTFEAAVTRTVWRNKLEEHQKREAGRGAGGDMPRAGPESGGGGQFLFCF